MSASIHPPVQLHIVLDEDSYQGGDSVEMARRFTAVAPTEVVRAAKGSQRANVLRFDLGDDTVTAEADDDPLWRDALATWLDEEFAETLPWWRARTMPGRTMASSRCRSPGPR